jgi:hypothetical protein
MHRMPKHKTTKQLKMMTHRQATRYAMNIHLAWADKHKQDMEWDLYWALYYKTMLKEVK